MAEQVFSPRSDRIQYLLSILLLGSLCEPWIQHVSQRSHCLPSLHISHSWCKFSLIQNPEKCLSISTKLIGRRVRKRKSFFSAFQLQCGVWDFSQGMRKSLPERLLQWSQLPSPWCLNGMYLQKDALSKWSLAVVPHSTYGASASPSLWSNSWIMKTSFKV